MFLQINWEQIIQNVGVMGTVVLVLIYIQWKRDIARDANSAARESRIAGDNRGREDRFSTQIATLETFIREELMDLVKTSQVIMVDNTKALSALTTALLTKPCLVGSHEIEKQLQSIVDRAIERGLKTN